jgi:hypothetical protein
MVTLPLLLTGLPDPGSAAWHFGNVAPYADQGLVGEVDGLMGFVGLGLIALFKEANEIEDELLGFFGKLLNILLNVV